MIGVTSEGEWALGRLVDRYSDFCRAGAGTNGLAARTLSRHAATGNLNALVDFVAVAESFAVARLLIVAPNLNESAASSWPKRRKEWLTNGPIDLARFNEWEALMGFVDARNAIQHGLGRLTTMQLVKYKNQVIGQLRAAEIRLDGDLLVVRVADVERCLRTCRGFITWLDAAAPVPPINA